MLGIDKLDCNLAVFSGLTYKYISLPLSLPQPKYNSRMEAEWIFPFPVKWILLYPSLFGVKRTNLTQNFSYRNFASQRSFLRKTNKLSYTFNLLTQWSFSCECGQLYSFPFSVHSEGVSVTSDKHTSHYFMNFLNHDVLLFSVRLLKFLTFELMVT